MSEEFVLHERLRADTFHVSDMPLCRVLLMNDQRWPWLVLVPRQPDLRDLHNVEAADQPQLWQEIDKASRHLEQRFSAFKLNVAALGNLVPQLHIHVIARFEDDPAWPGPVWGVGEAMPYAREAADTLVRELAQALEGL